MAEEGFDFSPVLRKPADPDDESPERNDMGSLAGSPQEEHPSSGEESEDTEELPEPHLMNEEEEKTRKSAYDFNLHEAPDGSWFMPKKMNFDHQGHLRL